MITKDTKPQPSAPPSGWPEPLGRAAQQGLIGNIVQAIAPQTEADPAAILVQGMTLLGSAFGPSSHCLVGATRHGANLFCVSSGETARARKGSGMDMILDLVKRADPSWVEQRIQSGLSTGEGLIALTSSGGGNTNAVSGGFSFVEDEFAAVLRVSGRRGNTLSTTLRRAWDGRTLQIVTRQSPVRIVGAHVSLAGHITQHDMSKYMDLADVYGGLFNRTLFVCSRRWQFLPEGGELQDSEIARLVKEIKAALKFARRERRVIFSDRARELWREKYFSLTAPEEISPLVDAATARGEAQTLRLALIYALADKSPVIKLQHLRAALEVWRYCRDSAEYIFGRTHSSIQGRILQMLPESGAGLSLTELSQAFSNHRSSQELSTALQNLRQKGLVESEAVKTGGRTATRWVRTPDRKGKKGGK